MKVNKTNKTKILKIISFLLIIYILISLLSSCEKDVEVTYTVVLQELDEDDMRLRYPNVLLVPETAIGIEKFPLLGNISTIAQSGVIEYDGKDFYYDTVRKQSSAYHKGLDTIITAYDESGRSIYVGYAEGYDFPYVVKVFCECDEYEKHNSVFAFPRSKYEARPDEFREQTQDLLDEFDVDVDFSDFEVRMTKYNNVCGLFKGPLVLQRMDFALCRSCRKITGFRLDGMIDVDEIYDMIPETEEEYEQILFPVLEEGLKMVDQKYELIDAFYAPRSALYASTVYYPEFDCFGLLIQNEMRDVNPVSMAEGWHFEWVGIIFSVDG